MALESAQVKVLFDKIYNSTKADEVQITFSGGERAGTRFARNTFTANLIENDHLLNITLRIGKRQATIGTNRTDDAGLKKALADCEERAKLTPENPEVRPIVKGPQNYLPVEAAFKSTADFGPKERAEFCKQSIDICVRKGLLGAGYLPRFDWVDAVGNSAGLFGYYHYTGVNYILTVRTPDGLGSGYARDNGIRKVEELDIVRLTNRACDKAEASHKPQMIEPGKYTVILEPVAAARYVSSLLGVFDARSAEEGRSFMSVAGKKGETRLGQKIFSDKVTIRQDPSHPTLLSNPVGNEGLPIQKMAWIENGVVKNLSYDRFWAAKQGKEPSGGTSGIIMDGGTATIEDMIKATKRGLLVTNFWYIRAVDQMKVLSTGLTRDGLFLIENGKITKPLVNFRWNDSPAITLSNVMMLGVPERAQLFEQFEDNGTALIPPIMSEEFTMSSVAPGI